MIGVLSMPAVVREGDVCTGHDGYISRPAITGSNILFDGGIPVHRVGDLWSIHCLVDCHSGVLAAGSVIFFDQGISVGRVGDPIDCGSFCATGSSVLFSA